MQHAQTRQPGLEIAVCEHKVHTGTARRQAASVPLQVALKMAEMQGVKMIPWVGVAAQLPAASTEDGRQEAAGKLQLLKGQVRGGICMTWGSLFNHT